MVADNTNQADDTAVFLRAARSGDFAKVVEFLDTGFDINAANSNGLNALHLASKDGHARVVTELLKRGAKVDATTKKGNTALHIASLAGQLEVVNILIQNRAAVNIQSQNGFTPLYMAAQENHDEVVKLLLNNGANQSLATEDGFTPLVVAMQQGHNKVVSVLLENDSKGKVRLPALHIAARKDDCKTAEFLLQNDRSKPDVTSKSGFTPLHIAAHYGNANIARLLIKRGADVNYLAKHSISPLHVAAKWGKNNMVKLLLENSAQIDAKTRDGLTPLHCAARSGHEQVITTLLENSAPISARTKSGLAPLHMASQGDHVDAARILLYHRAPVDDVTTDYLTSLHVAAHCGHVRVAKLLLERKADSNARALNGFTPLHIACKKNRIKVVELLLKHGASIESTTESGLTPLHVASFMGCMSIVIFLLQHEANPDVPTIRGETPLHLAARANQTDIIRILLRNGAKVDARAREEQTPLHIASRLGNIDIVMLLLQHGAAVDTTTKDMYTALHIAAKGGQEEVAALLVENNASVKATTKNGYTPLHIAAKYGNMNVAEILLQKDSKLDAQGKNDISPLHLACHYDHLNVVNLLLEKGASPHLASQNGHTPLHTAARKNQMDIASALLEHGANANAESKAGFTPLHLSAEKGHSDMVNLLIEHGADPNHKAKNGLTALHLCAQEDFVKVASILVKNGADIESQTITGYRPIHVAGHFGNLTMIRFLLKQKANIDVRTGQNYTPLHQAAQQGHAHIVSILLEKNASYKARTNDGLTALNIAQKLGYISVIEVLKGLSYDSQMPDNKNWEERYKVVAPESLQETSLMSDSDDEGDSDALISEQPYRYLTADLMKSLRDDSLPIDVTRDDPIHRQDEKQEFAQSNNYCLAETFDSTDGLNLGRLHFRSFLISFLVDARGGAMKSCRHSGVRIIVPPRRAPMPIRVTCRLVKPSKVANPPSLMEGEALATRIIEMGPIGATFLGPVLIDIPHFASIREKEREIIILRSKNGETWKEHDNFRENDDNLLNTPHDPQMNAMHSGRITRILTTEFPQYFAIVTRIKQEVHVIGAEGGILTSSVDSHVQALFPPGALTKKIKVGLQAHVIPAELTAKLLGNCVAVSPVITIEPRRRKFHMPITVTIPVPQAANKGMINQYGGESPTLRLLCSIAGGTSESQWEDVTGSTPLTLMEDKVSFTTTVSARFWLMDCRNISAVPKMATELYVESLFVPYITNFVIYSKRMDIHEATLRILCMTDSREGMHTLERQEEFVEIVKSRDVEALDGKDLYIEFSGNLVPVTKSGVQLKFTFKAFRQNRLSFHVKVKDPLVDPVARMLFMREPKVAKGEPPQQPICVLNIVLPKFEIRQKAKAYEDSNIIDQKLDSLESKYKLEQKEKGDEPKETSPSERKFITDSLEREQTDAAIHESLAQKAASPLESVDASYPNKVAADQQEELSPTVEKQTYSEKRKFWEDISRKRESYQRSESEISRTSQLTINESDSENPANVISAEGEPTTEAISEVGRSETMEDLNVPDISECSVAEKAHYFEEQIQKELAKVPRQDSVKSEKEKEKVVKKTVEEERTETKVEVIEKYVTEAREDETKPEERKEVKETAREEKEKDEKEYGKEEVISQPVMEVCKKLLNKEREEALAEEVYVKPEKKEAVETEEILEEMIIKKREPEKADEVRRIEKEDRVEKVETIETTREVAKEKEDEPEKPRIVQEIIVIHEKVPVVKVEKEIIKETVKVEREIMKEDMPREEVMPTEIIIETVTERKGVEKEKESEKGIKTVIEEEIIVETKKPVESTVVEEIESELETKAAATKEKEMSEPEEILEKEDKPEKVKEHIEEIRTERRVGSPVIVEEIYVKGGKPTRVETTKIIEEIVKEKRDLPEKRTVEEDRIQRRPESPKEKTGRRIITEETTIIYKVQKDGTLVQEQIVKSVQIEGGHGQTVTQMPEVSVETKIYEKGLPPEIGYERQSIEAAPVDVKKEIQQFLEGERRIDEDEGERKIDGKPEKPSTVQERATELLQKVEEIARKTEEKELEEEEEEKREIKAEVKQVKKESRIPIPSKVEKDKAPKEIKTRVSPAEGKPMEKPEEKVTTPTDVTSPTKKEFESRIPKRVVETAKQPDKEATKKDTYVKKESETYTVTEKKSSEETSKQYEERSTKSERQTFSKAFTDPQEAFKIFEDLGAAAKGKDFATVTSKVDHKASSKVEKKEVVSSEISSGADKIITHEEKERVERKKSSESKLTKESPGESLEEKKSKSEELDKTAVQKLSMNLTEGKEVIDASASESRAESKKEASYKMFEDKEGITTEESGKKQKKESDVDVAIRIEKDTKDRKKVEITEESPKISKPEEDLGKVEMITQGESHRKIEESFDVKQFIPSEKPEETPEKSPTEKEEAETLEKRQEKQMEKIEARTIAENLIQSIESEIERRSSRTGLKPELLSREYLEKLVSEESEMDHEKLADDLTRKFESIMKKSTDDVPRIEPTKLKSSLHEELQEKGSTKDSMSISEDITKDEESSSRESFPLSSSYARLLDRDITMSPSSISDQIEMEETIDVDTNVLEDVSKHTSSVHSEKQSEKRSDRSSAQVEPIQKDISFHKDKMVSEASGARVLEILEPSAESQSRQDSVDVPSLEMDEHKFSEPTSKDIPSLHESAAADSLERLYHERDITLSPSTVSEDTNVDDSLIHEHVAPSREFEERGRKRADSFEIESPPMVSPRTKAKGLEIKPVDWMIGDEKIEISETLQPSQVFNQELEEYESSIQQQKRKPSQDESTDIEQESVTKSTEDVSVIESVKESVDSQVVTKSTKFTVVPVSERELEKELVEKKLDISCQELVDILQKEHDAKIVVEGEGIKRVSREESQSDVSSSEKAVKEEKKEEEKEEEIEEKKEEIKVEKKEEIKVEKKEDVKVEEKEEKKDEIKEEKKGEMKVEKKEEVKVEKKEEKKDEIKGEKKEEIKVEKKEEIKVEKKEEKKDEIKELKKEEIKEEKKEEIKMEKKEEIKVEKKEDVKVEKKEEKKDEIKEEKKDKIEAEKTEEFTSIISKEEPAEEIKIASLKIAESMAPPEKQEKESKPEVPQKVPEELSISEKKSEPPKEEPKKPKKPSESSKEPESEASKTMRVDDVLKEWTEAYLTKIKPPSEEYKRHAEKSIEKHDRPGKSAVPSDTCAFKLKKEEIPVDLSARYAITVLDQVVKKEIAEVKESLEAARQDLIEELSENSENVIQIKDSPSEFQFKLQSESIPNDLPFLYKPTPPEHLAEHPAELPPEHPQILDEKKEEERKDETKEEEETDKEEPSIETTEEKTALDEQLLETKSVETEKLETTVAVLEDTEEDEGRPSPLPVSSSDADCKDDSSSLLPPHPVTKRRQKPARSSRKVTSESEADLGSSSGESSNYQSCDYEIGSGSRPSSSDVEALQSGGMPSASEYESALMSIDQTASRPTSQEYQTAASTLSSRESMKSLCSLNSGHLGSIDSTSELSETLVPSETEVDKEESREIEENLEYALEEEREASESSGGSDIPVDEPLDKIDKIDKIDSHIPCRMKRSSEMIFQQVVDDEATLEAEQPTEEPVQDTKAIDSSTSAFVVTPGVVKSVDIMTSRVTEDGIQSVCTQVISTATTEADVEESKETEKIEAQIEPDSLEPRLSLTTDESLETLQSTMQQQASMSTSSTSGMSVETVVEREKSDRHSPDSDSFELIDKPDNPDIIDDFIVIEEVAKEVEEYDAEGKSIRISSIPQATSKNYDRDLENLITETKEDSQVFASQASRNNELFDFESGESPPQASNDDQYSQSYSDEEQYDSGKKWIEMQFQTERVYDIEYDRGPLEDIKEEEITDFEAGSSRFGSLGSHKESVGSIGSVRGSFGSTPDYDVLAGKKYFTRPSDHDNVSLSSLQEFEHLESTVAAENSKKVQCGSQDSINNGSLPRRYMTSRSGHGDDISLSSLKDFEGLERACREAHLIELRAREEEDLLEHESPENRYKLESLARTKPETSAAGSFNPSTSGSDDYEKRIKEIDEIIRIAQSNVEKFDRQDDTTEDISQIEITDAEKTGTQGAQAAAMETEEVPPQKEINVMETSTDSLEMEDNEDKKHHPLCRSSDSLEMKTTLDFPSLSSDSLNNVRDSKETQQDVAEQFSNARRISSDSLDMPIVEQQDTEGQEKDESNGNRPENDAVDNSVGQTSSTETNIRNGKTKPSPSSGT